MVTLVIRQGEGVKGQEERETSKDIGNKGGKVQVLSNYTGEGVLMRRNSYVNKGSREHGRCDLEAWCLTRFTPDCINKGAGGFSLIVGRCGTG